MINREKLVVGSIWVSKTDITTKEEIVALGKEQVIFRKVNTGVEGSCSIDNYLEHMILAPKEPKLLGRLVVSKRYQLCMRTGITYDGDALVTIDEKGNVYAVVES